MTDNREIRVSLILLEDWFSKGNRIEHPLEVTDGPDPDARIIGVAFDSDSRQIILRYDRPVPDTCIFKTHSPAWETFRPLK